MMFMFYHFSSIYSSLVSFPSFPLCPGIFALKILNLKNVRGYLEIVLNVVFFLKYIFFKHIILDNCFKRIFFGLLFSVLPNDPFHKKDICSKS